MLSKYDPAGDGHVTFDDFVRYVTEHEKALRLSFESLDHKGDGKLLKLLFSWSVVSTPNPIFLFVIISFIRLLFIAAFFHKDRSCIADNYCNNWKLLPSTTVTK